MAEAARPRDQESPHLVLLNTLKEAEHQMVALEVEGEARETLRALIHLCQTDFDKLYR